MPTSDGAKQLTPKMQLAKLYKARDQKDSAGKQRRRKDRLDPPFPYRSWFEVDIAIDALERGIVFEYEKGHIVWIEPEKVRKYKPDYFVTKRNGDLMLVEAKGRWTAEDRKKICFVTEQNPDLDLRMLFERDNTLSKAKRSQKYSDWCTKKGIKFAIGRSIPEEWLDE